MIPWTQIAIDAEIEGVETLNGIFLKNGFSHVHLSRVYDNDGKRWFQIHTYLPTDETIERRKKALEKDLWHLTAFDLCAMTEPVYTTLSDLPIHEDEKLVARVTDAVAIVPPESTFRPAEGIVVVQRNTASFGTGLHPSTKLAVEALSVVSPAGKTVIDVGTGTGILAIVAAKLGARTVEGIDIDAQAAADATANVALNQTNTQSLAISISHASVTDVSIQYDLVIANLPASLLIHHHRSLINLLHVESHLVLSGMTATQVPAVRQVFEAQRLEKVAEIEDNDWKSLIYRKAPEYQDKTAGEAPRGDKKQKSGGNPSQSGPDHRRADQADSGQGKNR